jgi:hypothetical protein
MKTASKSPLRDEPLRDGRWLPERVVAQEAQEGRNPLDWRDASGYFPVTDRRAN